MKKLFCAGVAVVATVVAQAASVQWTTTAIWNPTTLEKGQTPAKAGSTSDTYNMAVNFYTYDAASGAYDKLFTTVEWDTTKSNSKMQFTTENIFAANTQYGIDVHIDYLDGSKYYIQTDEGYFVTPAQGVATLDATGIGFIEGKTFAFDASKLEAGSGTWQTPEPTSGMLLLLGMAGLALKRKRA